LRSRTAASRNSTLVKNLVDSLAETEVPNGAPLSFFFAFFVELLTSALYHGTQKRERTSNKQRPFRASSGSGARRSDYLAHSSRIINPSELPTPANVSPPNHAGADQSDTNPLASFAHKPLDER
jgi:hypothetical protein